MKKFYSLKNNSIILTNFHKKKRIHNILSLLFKGLIWISISIVIFMVIEYIFWYILYPKRDLYDAISLGAVFATIASTVISIATLLCNRSYEDFYDCLNILKNELLSKTMDINWSFLKKGNFFIKTHNETLSGMLETSKIVFEIYYTKLEINIPTQKKDFYEWKLLKNIIKMLIFQKMYLSYLIENSNQILESGIYVWECVYHMLCYALYYRIWRLLIVLGIILFFCGVFSIFTYPWLFNEIFNTLSSQ